MIKIEIGGLNNELVHLYDCHINYEPFTLPLHPVFSILHCHPLTILNWHLTMNLKEYGLSHPIFILANLHVKYECYHDTRKKVNLTILRYMACQIWTACHFDSVWLSVLVLDIVKVDMEICCPVLRLYSLEVENS